MVISNIHDFTPERQAAGTIFFPYLETWWLINRGAQRCCICWHAGKGARVHPSQARKTWQDGRQFDLNHRLSVSLWGDYGVNVYR